MRKKISNLYSKAFPKKNGEEYSTKELIFLMVAWLGALTIFFIVVKFLQEKYHLDKLF